MLKALQWILTFFLTAAGMLSVFTVARRLDIGSWLWLLTAFVGLAVLLAAYWLSPRLLAWLRSAGRWIEEHISKLPSQEIIAGVAGLIIGLIIANLLGASLSRLPIVGSYLALAGNVVLGYLGWSVFTKKREEFLALLPRTGNRDKTSRQGADKNSGRYKVLDTSVIIDGRILDICQTGFLEGVMVVPDFVLEELRHIADSSDVLKRNRGRRGLDVLNKIREQSGTEVQLMKTGRADQGVEVDTRLVLLAQQLQGSIVTNDFNLNKVAALQGIKVLNINELANAVKPVVLPGEEMVVQLIKDGKESGQGVGYLDDGTMIVVENGRRFIGQTVSVLVTSVLQTAAGRMIFARPKGPVRRVSSSSSAGSVERGEFQWLT